MTALSAQARLKAALPAVLERIRATTGVYAALWCGSASRGEANEFSDLDIHVLIEGTVRWRSNFTIDSVPVEVFHNPARKVRAMFMAGEGDTITMFAQGKVLLPHPELDALVFEARALYDAGPAPRPLSEQARHRLIDEVMDARTLADRNDPLHMLVAMGTLHTAVTELYALRGWWEVKRERWLTDLADREPDAAQELLGTLTSADADARQRALEALVVRLTDDLAYRDGASDPQPVP